MILRSDPATWPQPNSVWAPSDGTRYRVLFCTNVNVAQNVTVVYQNCTTGALFSKNLIDWTGVMALTPVSAAPTERTCGDCDAPFHMCECL